MMIYIVYALAVLVIVLQTTLPKYKIKDFNIYPGLIALGVGLIVLMFLSIFLPDSALIIDPVALRLGNLEVRWYALWIMLGVIVAVIMGIREGRKIGIYSDFIYTGIIIILPIALIGARIWYVLFNLDEFHSLGDVFGLRDGWSGLGIQGGVIAAIIAIIIYCKVTKVSLFKAFDLVAPGFLIGQVFGRWGNFCNHELYGPLVQNVDLFNFFLPRFISENMYISGSYLLNGLSAGYYQPMFLYESCLNLIGLVILLFVRRKSKMLESGDMLGLYLIWYGVVRTITESFRFEGEVLMLGGIRISILTSIIFILCGVLYLVLKHLFLPQNKYLDIINQVKENHIDTVIFDLDGTLLDTKRLIEQSFIHTFEKFYPEHELTDQELDAFFGPTLKESFSKYAKDANEVEEMIKYYREYNVMMHDEMVEAFPGVKDVLKYLKKHNYKLAVVSSKKSDLVNHGLEFCKIREYFDLVVGSDEVKNPKPDPEGINYVLKTLGSKNGLYVGDSTMDIIAGKNANIKTCAVIYPNYETRKEDLINLEPDYIITKMYSLVKTLGE